jgi:hypothetical protein
VLADWEAVRTIPQSPLVDVVGVARNVVAAGLTVELLAIERRAQGAVLYWRARSDREGMLLSADVSISDDRDTPYHVIRGNGGGDSHAWEGQTIVLPAPPAGARLMITILSFGPNDQMPMLPDFPTEHVTGPWTFEIDLPPEPPTTSREAKNG